MTNVMRVFGLVAFALLLMVAIPVAAQQSGTPGVFDYYLFNLSWEPEFCRSPRNQDSEECQTGGRGFIVHGLWPQFTRGYPEHCSYASGPRLPFTMLDLMPDKRLVRHEWVTHGTCSGLGPEEYFMRIREAWGSVKIPKQLVHPAQNFSISPIELKQAFVAINPDLQMPDIGISCGHNFLTAVQICLSKDTLKPLPCGIIRDCHANSIRVSPVR